MALFARGVERAPHAWLSRRCVRPWPRRPAGVWRPSDRGFCGDRDVRNRVVERKSPRVSCRMCDGRVRVQCNNWKPTRGDGAGPWSGSAAGRRSRGNRPARKAAAIAGKGGADADGVDGRH